jgi:hypothetical protein
MHSTQSVFSELCCQNQALPDISASPPKGSPIFIFRHRDRRRRFSIHEMDLPASHVLRLLRQPEFSHRRRESKLFRTDSQRRLHRPQHAPGRQVGVTQAQLRKAAAQPRPAPKNYLPFHLNKCAGLSCGKYVSRAVAAGAPPPPMAPRAMPASKMHPQSVRKRLVPTIAGNSATPEEDHIGVQLGFCILSKATARLCPGASPT